MFDEFGRVKGKNTWYKMIHENCKLIFCAKGISNLNEKCYIEKKNWTLTSTTKKFQSMSPFVKK